MPISLHRLKYSGVCTLVSRFLAAMLLLLLWGMPGRAQSGIKLVQHRGIDAGITTTASLAFVSANTAGNWIGVAIRGGMSSSQVFTIVDSNGNTYKKAAQVGFTSSAVTLAIYYAENIKGGANTVTVSETVSGPFRIAILEYSGVATSNSVDVAAATTGVSTSPNSGNLNTTASGDLLLGAVGTADSETLTAGSGYTIEDSVPAAPNTKLITEDQIQAAAGVASATATLTSSDAWGVVLAAFKSAGGVISPTITGLVPTAGSVGTSVTIAGANFGSSQGSSTVTFNGITATPTSWSATSIVAPVPAGATTGNVVVTVGGLASNPLVFTVTSAPIITSVTPTSGPVGTSVTIAGANFGSSQGSSTVTFNGATATPTTWGAMTIVVPVPAGANTGNIVVTVGGVASNAVPFSVTVVTSIKLAQTANLDAGTTTTASLAFTSSNTAGNWIGVVIRAGLSSSQVFTVTDSNGNAYRQAVQLGLTANSMTTAIYYAENIKGGANTVTVSDTVSGPLRIAILEYSGIAMSSSLDGTAMGQGVSATPSSGNLTTAASGDLLLSTIATVNSGSFTPGTGYTIEDFVPAPPNTKLIAEDQIQASAGTVSAGATLATSDNWGAVLVAVKAPGGVAGAPSSITATAGTPQSTGINTAFAIQLQATVKDPFNNPVSGVTVTFTAPTNGASGSFAGGVHTATTNAQGVATAPIFTANSVAGAYNVSASVTGVAAVANFSLTNLAGAASAITATAGTPQSATINTAFGTQLQTTVKDSFNNPVSGVTVTFAAPSSGASGTFAGGVNTATTNAQGVATAAVFTANGTAGGPYTVTATATGVSTPANFSLTNTAGAASTITATAGTPQNATISTAFATQLQVTVKDSFTNPVSGVTVTFAAPSSGASGTFAGGVKTATTNAQGVATAAVFTANSVAGGYSVTASVTGVATATNFSLTNLAGAASGITATSGTPQSATVNTVFATQLQATVTDSGNNPVSGVTVTFTAPTSGASGTFAGGVNTATTNAQGVATAPVFTANSTAGGPYNVTASATGVATPANFSLTNLGNPPASITATAGTPQNATISTAFAIQLQVTVKDASSNPVSGVAVSFTAPTSGASGTFAGGVNTATTNAQGVATAAVFTANSTAGGPYNVAASVAGVATPANFSLTNLTGAASTVIATAGTPQNATVNTAFTTQLQVTVTDSGNNPVSGISVTFTAPTNGASGGFAGGVNTATTNAQGVATAPIFTANSVAGAYNVSASVTGVAAIANFSLTNLAGAASAITATAGTPQSATINTAFGTQLQTTVKDSFNNPVSGVTVTFAAPSSGASGTFAGGVNTATTNAQGVATAAVFTANGTAGGPYTVTATATGVGTPANFSLTNTASVTVNITLVQHTSLDAGITTTGSLAFKSSNAAGNWVGVAIRAGFSSSQAFTVTDSNGNTYKKAVQIGFTPTSVTLAIYYAENIKGGANAVTVTDTVSGPLRIAILEYSGVATSNSVDASVAATGTSASPNSGSLNTTASGDLLLAAVAATNSEGFAAASGYTLEDSVPAPPNTKLITEDQIQASAGAASAGATLSGSDTWGAVLAAFKSASTGSTGPSITSLSQTTGAVGLSITITGTNFGATQGASTVTFNGTTAAVSTWSSTSIVVTVPAGATTGPAVVTVGGVASNGVNFTVIPTPNISSINPTSGPRGTSVIITGTNFGTSQGSSTVTFNAIAGSPTGWSATSIVVPVPNGATTGNVVVTVAGSASNGVLFTVTTTGPSISSLSLTQGPVGATFTVNGSNFGATQGSSSVTLNGTVMTAANWTATSMDVTVPSGATSGNVVVTVNGVASNGAIFTVTPTPAITNINPSAGPIGTNVIISGTNFGPTVGSIQSFVTFNGVQTRASNWTDTSITAPVPAGATTGNILVSVGGVPSNGVLFTVGAVPSITSLSQTAGAVGTSVTISGANFGASQGTSTVTFNGTAGTPTSWNATAIVVPVPAGATTGNVVVTVNGIASNGVNFTVTTSNNISLVQHRSLDAGTATSGSLAFTSNNASGNWIGVAIRAGLSSSQVFTVTDTNGNTYQRAFQLGVGANSLTFALYYAENIKGGANIVTVSDTVSGPFRFAILEYSGVATSNSLDATPATAQGSSSTPNSGSLTTGAGGDLLLGTVVTINPATITAGSGYTIEEAVPGAPNTKLIAEDQLQTTAGSASASASLASSDTWGAGLAAFRSINGTALPITISVSPTAASVPSGYGTQNVTATVANDFQNRGATWSLSGAGCSGSTCGTLSGITTTSVTYNAPPNVPSPATVTLTATAVGDTTKTASATITVTQGVINVAVTPRRAAVTLSASQTVQFTANVVNDPSNAGVTWQVDGNNGGNATTGTVSATGLYTPGMQAGQHTVTAVSNANANVSASAIVAVTDLTGVYTQHNDNARTGQNVNEYGLTPATVSPSTFGQLFSCPVDSYVYAQPLWVANLNVGGKVRNVVFIATEHDSVYAFDADSPSCVQLWQVNFLGTGVTTMGPSDLGGNTDITPEIGITSTPVIDPATSTLYVMPKTKETVGTVNGQACSTASPCYVHRLHALDLFTGAEKFGGPVVISATNFNSFKHLQRPALLLANNTLYIAFGSHGDQCPYQGWVMGYNPSTLAQVFALPLTVPPPSQGCTRGGIWLGGVGPAADANGNVYVSLGNGAYDGNNNFGDSAVKLSPTGSILDWFTPFDQSVFLANDIDLASSGIVVLPDSVASTTHPHLALATGKVAILYLLDISQCAALQCAPGETKMGKFNSSTDNDVQEVVPVPPPNTTLLDGGNYGVPAYWNGNIYTTGQNFPLSQFHVSNGTISTPQSAQSTNTFPPRGGIPGVSANGTTGGVVWIIDYTGWQANTPAILDAYDANNVGTLLYSSPTSGTGAAGPAVKFTTPTIANGRAYVGTQFGFSVYGMLP